MSDREIYEPDVLLDLVREAIREVVRPSAQPIELETKLASLGLDSMAALEVAAHLEDRLGLILPDDRIGQVVSVRDLVAELERHVAASAEGAAGRRA